MALGDVVDQLLDEHGLADAGAAEQADLAALGVGREEVDDLDAGDEDRGLGRLVDEKRRVAWIGAVSVWPIGPRSSIGSPITFMIRPRVIGPTGTRIWPPVSRTGWPRVRPSVESIAMVRTVDSPRCWATSRTRRLPLLSVSRAERISGERAFEGDVDDGADHLADASGRGAARRGNRVSGGWPFKLPSLLPSRRTSKCDRR
jgi:hypothetical protein